jgi:Tfp pilus assembly protein PilF
MELILRLGGYEAMANSLEGLFAMHDGKPEQALEFLQKGVKMDPDDCSPYISLGDGLMAIGDYVAARQSYNEALCRTHTVGDTALVNKLLAAINGIADKK